MKKIVTIFLIVALIITIVPINVFATTEENICETDILEYTNSELDLTQYTMQDIQSLSVDEYIELVHTFERVYDPYGSYTARIDIEDSTESTINPRWSSGDISNNEWVEVGCHESITMVACSVLLNDKGFFSDNSSSAIGIMLSISLASLLPDEDEVGILPYAGHFYNPLTNLNYALQSDNTAKTNAASHYEEAVEAANNGNMNLAYEHLGRCLHYVQDANEPHHAQNITGVNPSHGEFEDFAYEHQDEYISGMTTLTYESYYTNALRYDVEKIVHDAASVARLYAEDVNNILNKSNWAEVAEICLQNAVKSSTMIMYKFGQEVSVPFF